VPLPTADVAWPPADCARAAARYTEWGAWYSGDRDELQRVYLAATGYREDPGGITHMHTGPSGKASRWFWGQLPATNGVRDARIHVPLASDIAVTSADLLFGDMPDVVLPDESSGSQDRLDQVLADGAAHSTLIEHAEACAAYGGAYLRVWWDQSIATMPMIDSVPPDAVVPEWGAGGYLRAAILWRVVAHDSGDVWRHLEYHTAGGIEHALYRGSEATIGVRVPLAQQPATAGYPDEPIATGADRPCVEYVPNMRPARGKLRGLPLGRSDYQGAEATFDALDEVWSSWMRDIRLGKGRIILSHSMLERGPNGQGGWWDAEREVVASVNAFDGDNGPGITAQQFAIRVAEHQQSAAELTAQAIRAGGYALSTFAEADAPAMTATEANQRERRTYKTRSRKIGYVRPRLARLIKTLMQVDAYVFGQPVTPDTPTLEWPDAVSDSPADMASTLQLLRAAEAISIETMVDRLNPDWSDEQKAAEVERIKAESRAPAPAEPSDSMLV
jgi:A118 family predicted phage portal protein